MSCLQKSEISVLPVRQREMRLRYNELTFRFNGSIMHHDYVAIDEVKLVKFGDVNEMRSVMQGYMERGRCEVNGHEVVSDAGVVFLGNIETDNMDEYKNMLTELPSLFQESALLDRMHGFIKGWDIPPMQPGLKISGWALNTEYFCTVLHLLREDMSYRASVLIFFQI